MRALIPIVLFMLATAFRVPAQEQKPSWGWPLAIQDGISSTFQEFRSNHFHAGIDMRTLQRTGFPVMAVADGVIERITVTQRGYGLSLRLRHAGGFSSLYSHLERFRDDIAAIVSQERIRSGRRYFGDRLLDRPLAVRRGEVIAFSGESGAGFAHLHLEIRDGADRAINPLTLIDDQPLDRHPPRLRGVLLRSRAGSLINGDCGEFYFRLRHADGAFVLAEPLRIDGPCDVTLDALDLSDVGHVVAPYSLEARLNGRLVFQQSFDSLSRDDNNQLGMLYDMAYSSTAAYFFNLCSQSGFALEKTGMRLADELQRLAPGRHEIRVIVSDRQQNRSQAILPFVKAPAGEPCSVPKRPAAAAGNGQMQGSGISVFLNRGDVVVKVSDLSAPAAQLQLKIVQGKAERTIAAREFVHGAYFCFQPLNHEPRLLLRLELSENGLAVEARQMALQLVWLKNDLAQTARLGDFAAEFGATSVREPTVLLIEPVALQPELPLLGTAMRTDPVHFAFLDAVHYKFRVPAGTERTGQLGIFKYRPATKKWNYVPTQADREPGYLSCRVLTAGTFALLRDVFPPAISLRRPGSRRLGALTRLVVRLSDKGKGIDDSTLTVVLNGRKLEAEYDPDWGHVLLEELAHLKKGRNELLVRVGDLAGNFSQKRFFFQLK
jgi:hypothetical protein